MNQLSISGSTFKVDLPLKASASSKKIFCVDVDSSEIYSFRSFNNRFDISLTRDQLLKMLKDCNKE